MRDVQARVRVPSKGRKYDPTGAEYRPAREETVRIRGVPDDVSDELAAECVAVLFRELRGLHASPRWENILRDLDRLGFAIVDRIDPETMEELA